MKKYLFISNRQSGKTRLSVYEFLKDPENSFLILPNREQIKSVINLEIISDNFLNRIFFCDEFNSKIRGFRIKVKRIIWDDYLMSDTTIRSEMDNNFHLLGVEEIYCFSTPSKIYDKKILDFVKEIKKDKRILNIEEYINTNQLLIEMNDLKIKSSAQINNEILDLYYNYLTDPDTKIIHNKVFYNEKIYRLENVSYFPDTDRELTELKGKYTD